MHFEIYIFFSKCCIYYCTRMPETKAARESIKSWGSTNVEINLIGKFVFFYGLAFSPIFLQIFGVRKKVSSIYDFLIKGGILGEIGLVQFLIDCDLMRKNIGEIIYIPKDRIFDVLQSEIKFLLLCTHKAHLWTWERIYDFSRKFFIFPSK